MNKNQLIDEIAIASDLPKAVAGRALEATFNVITNALKKGLKVPVSEFGKFDIKHRAARTGRNPQTGEVMQIPESRVVSFKASKALKDSIALPNEALEEA